MCSAVNELRNKGVEISREEEQAVKIAHPPARYRSWAFQPRAGKCANGRNAARSDLIVVDAGD
jgi:hypothetical protein